MNLEQWKKENPNLQKKRGSKSSKFMEHENDIITLYNDGYAVSRIADYLIDTKKVEFTKDEKGNYKTATLNSFISKLIKENKIKPRNSKEG